MDIKILSEAFAPKLHTITNTTKAILSPDILKKFSNEIIDNKDGVLYKISYYNEFLNTDIEKYVSCIEFTAPTNTIIVSNMILHDMFLNLTDINTVSLDIFYPPQASRVKFKLDNNNILSTEDIKTNLENFISNSYKFLELNQILKLNGTKLTIIELEPYKICMVNNTDMEVEFECNEKPTNNLNSISNSDSSIVKTIVNTQSSNKPNNIQVKSHDLSSNNGINDEPVRLTKKELRIQRLKYFSSLS